MGEVVGVGESFARQMHRNPSRPQPLVMTCISTSVPQSDSTPGGGGMGRGRESQFGVIIPTWQHG